MSAIEKDRTLAGAAPSWPWNLAMPGYLYLSTQDSQTASLLIQAGDNTDGNNPNPDWKFTLDSYDFTGKLSEKLIYPSVGNFDAVKSSIPVFHVSQGGGSLTQIEIEGPDRYQQSYRINFVGTNLKLILGFYFWAGSDATQPSPDGGLTFSFDEAYWGKSPNTTCFVQISNTTRTNHTSNTLNSVDNQQIWLAWPTSET